MINSESSTQQDKPAQIEEFFDAVRRHTCQILGFDYGFIDVVKGHEIKNVASFSADDDGREAHEFVHSLVDEHQQPVTIANTHVSQKVKQTQKPWVGVIYTANNPETASATDDIESKADSDSQIQAIPETYPYAIVPIVEKTMSGNIQVRGLVRVISFDASREITAKDLSTLQLMGEHLCNRMPQLMKAGDEELDHDEDIFEADTILVVHSERQVRRRYVRILVAKYKVLEANTADNALAILQQNKVDLIVLDSEVIGTSGFAFCKVLKDSKQWKQIPVILVTSEANPTARVEGLNVGADDCLSESCFDSELLARVRSSLRHRKTERELAVQLELLEDYALRLEKATESLSQDKQQQLQRNQELEYLRWQADRLRGQDALLHRISNTIRRSLNINENLNEMLEELAGWFNLDCCFVVLPSETDPEDTLRGDFCTSENYKVVEPAVDLEVLDVYTKHFHHEQMIVSNIFDNDRQVEPFANVLNKYNIFSFFCLPITYERKLLGLLSGFKCESQAQWNDDNKAFLRSVADQVAIGVINARLYSRVQRQATTDGLTGLYNHRSGQEKLAEQLRVAERYQRHLSVVMIDVDHFKSINDTHGHPAGDTVLKAVAKLVKGEIRDVDFSIRYGGEEFLLVLPEVNQEGAVVVAERIRKNLSQETIKHQDISINVTASFGIASFPEDARNQKTLLDFADRALYLSKRQGRNQVHTVCDLMFEEAPPQVPAKRLASSPPPDATISPVTASQTAEPPALPDTAPQALASAISPAIASQSPRPTISPVSVTQSLVPRSSPASETQSAELARSPSPDTKSFEPDGSLFPAPGLERDASAPQSQEPPVPVGQAIEATADAAEPKEELVPEVVEMVKALAGALYAKSDYNKIHHLETARLAELLAKVMNLSRQEVEQIRVASLLHDIGTLSIPSELLNKAGSFNEKEQKIIREHSVLGAELLRPIRALKDICEILEKHHERWDGKGYPGGLKGEEIPMPARIVSIVDAYHAMISDRPYRQALTREEAEKTLKEGAGYQWDPLMVNIFLTMLKSMDMKPPQSGPA